MEERRNCMNRHKLTFELRTDTIEMKALHKYLATLKSNDNRRYNKFIRTALLTFHAYSSDCEKFLKNGFDQYGIERDAHTVSPDFQRQNDVSQFTKEATSINNEQQKNDDSLPAIDETDVIQWENGEHTVSVDNDLAELLKRGFDDDEC